MCIYTYIQPTEFYEVYFNAGEYKKETLNSHIKEYLPGNVLLIRVNGKERASGRWMVSGQESEVGGWRGPERRREVNRQSGKISCVVWFDVQ